jgi:ketosteroid isomerase-like protein
MANPTADENAVRAANEAFYRALSAGSIEGVSAACAHDPDVTALHIARVAGLERVRGKMKDGTVFAFTALATNIYEKRDNKWLIVHHHASKAAEHLTT